MVRVFAACALTALLSSGVASAEERCPPSCDLEALLELAEAHGPDVERAEAGVAWNEARRAEAYYAPLDLGSARMWTGPTAERRGDIVHSAQPDVYASETMGLYTSIRIEVALALTPWWRIVSYWRAARAAVDMSNREVDQRRAEARVAAERAYRDAQVTVAADALLRRARRNLNLELARVERLLEEDLAGADEGDRLRLNLDRTGLDARVIGLRREKQRALALLRQLTGLERGDRIQIDPLETELAPLQPLDWYLEAARLHRPEVQLSFAGIRAAEAMVDVRRSEFVPDLAIGGYYNYNSTPVADNQTSSYSRDPWNGAGLGYGLVYMWELGIGERYARLRQARADEELARAMRRHALGGVAYEVESAYAETLEQTRAYEARRHARDLSRSWLDRVRDELARNETNVEAVSDAFGMWMSQEIAYLRALARLHQVRAELHRAAGLTLSSDEERQETEED